MGEQAGTRCLRKELAVAVEALLQGGNPGRVAGKVRLGIGIELGNGFVGEKQVQPLAEVGGVAQPQNLPAVDGEEGGVFLPEAGRRGGVGLLHIGREFAVEPFDGHGVSGYGAPGLRSFSVAGDEGRRQQAYRHGIAVLFQVSYHIHAFCLAFAKILFSFEKAIGANPVLRFEYKAINLLEIDIFFELYLYLCI